MAPRIKLPLEPRLLSRALAAAYCGISVTTFEQVCPLHPLRIRARVLFDRVAVDKWLDTLNGTESDSFSTESWLMRLDNVHSTKGR